MFYVQSNIELLYTINQYLFIYFSLRCIISRYMTTSKNLIGWRYLTDERATIFIEHWPNSMSSYVRYSQALQLAHHRGAHTAY